MYLFVNKEKCCPICIFPMWFYLTILGFAQFCYKIANYQLQRSLKYFSISRPMKNNVRFEYVPWKISASVLFSLFGFSLVIKLRNINFDSHWNTLIYFDKKRYVVRFEYVPWKTVWFCLISIVWVHFSHKTWKFRF